MTTNDRLVEKKISTTALVCFILVGSFIMAFQNVAFAATTGSLKVYTGITGVSVNIDGVNNASTDAYSGATVNGIEAGYHSLQLTMPGYKDWIKQVNISSGQTTTVYAYLEPGTGVATTRVETISYNSPVGTLRIYTGITNVKVFVGDEFGGFTDSYSGATVNRLPVGTYSLKLSLAGYKDWIKQVNISSGQTTTVYGYLESGTGVSITRAEILSYNSPVGVLKVYTGITGVSVYVADEYGGKTDSYSGVTVNGLAVGVYTLKLTMAGYKDWIKQVNISSGQTTTVYAYLEPGTGVATTRVETISYNSPVGTLRIYTGITNVKVFVGDEFGGFTDSYSGATVNRLPVGTYSLKLSLAGYKDWIKQVNISSGQTTTVYGYLESGTGVSITRAEILSYNSPVGVLKVYTGITGVSVYVADEYGGKTDSYSGVTVNGLAVGVYTLKLTMAGYKDWIKQVNISSGQTTTVYGYLESGTGVSITRAEILSYNSPVGVLKVYTGITGVSVYVADEYGGKTDSYSGVTVNGLAVGVYTLKLTMAGYKDWIKQVNISSGQTTTVYGYLESGTGVSITRAEILSYNSPVGVLKVYTGITGVSVYVADEYGGKTDSYSGVTVNGLVAGTYTLKLSLTGYKEWTKQVSFTVGKTTTVYAYLEPGTGVSTTRSETISYDSPYGTLKVNTGLTGVSVYVADEYGGKTDSYSGATINGLIAGTYTLKLTGANYNERTQQVTITTAQTTTVQALLTPTPSPTPTLTPTPTPTPTPSPTPTLTPTPTPTPTPSPTPTLTPTPTPTFSDIISSTSGIPQEILIGIGAITLFAAFSGVTARVILLRKRKSYSQGKGDMSKPLGPAKSSNVQFSSKEMPMVKKLTKEKSDLKPCLFCGDDNSASAKKCSGCGRDFE